MTDSADTVNPFPCARFIKEIGRGPNGARALTADDTRALYDAMLDGRVSELELGAVLLAYRVKGETADELAAMLAGAHASFEPLHPPARHVPARLDSELQRRAQAAEPDAAARAAARARRRAGAGAWRHRRSGPRDERRDLRANWTFRTRDRTPKSRTVSLRAASRSRRSACSRRSSRACCAAPASWACVIRRTRSSRSCSRSRQPGLRLVNYTHPQYRDSLTGLFNAASRRGRRRRAARARHRRRGGGGHAAPGAGRLVPRRRLRKRACRRTLVARRAGSRPARSARCADDRALDRAPYCAAKHPCRPRSSGRSN